MRGSSIIAVFGLISALAFSVAAQSNSKSETELLADREFAAAMAIRTDGIASVTAVAWEATVAKYRTAILGFQRARELYRQAGNRPNEAQSLWRIAELQKLIEEWPGARANLDAAISIFDELGKKTEVAKLTGIIGDTYFSANDFYNAINYYSRSLTLARETKDARLEGQVLTMLGRCHAGLFNRREALRYWEESVKVDEAAGSDLHLATTLEFIAEAHRDAGERQKAVASYSRALALYKKQSGDVARRKESETIESVAQLLAELGDFPRAIETLKTGIALDRAIGAKASEAGKLSTLAMAYHNLRDLKNGIRYLEESLGQYRTINDREGEASVLMLFSSIYLYDAGLPVKAYEFAEQALKLSTEIGNVRGQAEVLKRLGDITTHIPERRREAPEFMKRALELYRSLDDTRSAADLLKDIGIAYVFAGDRDKAIDYFNEALMTYTVLGLSTRLNVALYWLEQAWEGRGNRKLATSYGKQGILALQSQRRMIVSLEVEAQRTYLRSIENDYRTLVRLLLDQGRLKEAQQTLTAFKDAQSLDMADTVDAKQTVGLTFTPREGRFWARFIAISRDIVRAKRRLEVLNQKLAGRSATADETSDVSKATQDLDAQWRTYFEFVRTAPDEFSAPANEDDHVGAIDENTLIWNAVTEVSDQTRQPTVVVYQMVSEYRVDLLLVTPDEMKHVRVDAQNINEKARQFWAMLQSGLYDPRQLGKELYDVVFKPIEDQLPVGTKTILWSTDGNLRYVPMAALFDGERYLVERFNHVTFTRSDGDRLSRPVTPKWMASAFGTTKAHIVTSGGRVTSFSSLPGVNTELNSIFRNRIVSGDVISDAAFTQKRLMETLKLKRPMVHIASHFSFRPGDDTASFLLMGDGTPFTLADMKKQKDMFAGVELLTLSACNTAAQQADANGREVDAFFELAQRLGAQSVLATLWPVADNSTPWLMREFYDLKVNRSQNKAEALRNAQLSLLNGSAGTRRSRVRTDASPVKVVVTDDGSLPPGKTRAETFAIAKKDAKSFITDPKRPFAHPYYWAPFVLIGNWR